MSAIVCSGRLLVGEGLTKTKFQPEPVLTILESVRGQAVSARYTDQPVLSRPNQDGSDGQATRHHSPSNQLVLP